MIEGIPLWGSASVIGVLLSMLAAVVVMLFRGDIATRKEVDQVQKVADTLHKAWETAEHGREIAEETNRGQAEVLNKILVGQDTMMRVLDALPSKPVRKSGETNETP